MDYYVFIVEKTPETLLLFLVSIEKFLFSLQDPIKFHCAEGSSLFFRILLLRTYVFYFNFLFFYFFFISSFLGT